MNRTGEINNNFTLVSLCICVFFVFFFAACNQIEKPKSDPLYARNAAPPAVQEFRWSNGKMPKSFDPARASAAPETDIIRAVYEGLTDLDAKTLQPVPAIAVKWAASEDNKIWTFYLRKDARWSNGEPVTAKDFVRSWKRLVEMGDRVSQRGLFKNIVGMDTENVVPIFSDKQIHLPARIDLADKFLAEQKPESAHERASEQSAETPETELEKTAAAKPETPKNIEKKQTFGVEAVGNFTLKVSLVEPDEDFPALVAHPVFRPIYGDGKDFETNPLNPATITDGAFRVASVGRDGIVLTRADYFWNADKIELQRVRIVPSENAESALAAYRAGELDAVTNADFEPLALKLLTPYDDFRQTLHSALNFYEFNRAVKPFDDRRVREALATAIERERITEDEMDGVTEPALNFLPFEDGDSAKLSQDIAGAQKALAEAGFPDGKNFPAIRLLINRNNVQQRVARLVAKMWKKNLNVETKVVVKDTSDFETAVQNGEFDIVRRGVVLPTMDEAANMLTLFPPKPAAKKDSVDKKSAPAADNQISGDKSAEPKLNSNENAAAEQPNSKTEIAENTEIILTQDEALQLIPAIPLYFPNSYSLVKPYVQGFDINALDAPSLKNVRINHDWQPAREKVVSNDVN